MIEWRAEGTVLAKRRHGEHAAIIEAFTRDHGRHAGLVRGGGGRRMAPFLQPGCDLALSWRGRIEEHLGHFTVEPVRSRAALMGDPVALAGLSSVTALLSVTLPEREPRAALYDATQALLALMDEASDWRVGYLRWEAGLLRDMGYGLDLSRCAVTGGIEDLAFVSPKSGRSVSRDGAGDWAGRLFPLPSCLRSGGTASAAELADGLRITGHFLERRLADDGRSLPAARGRLAARLT